MRYIHKIAFLGGGNGDKPVDLEVPWVFRQSHIWAPNRSLQLKGVTTPFLPSAMPGAQLEEC